MFKNEQNVLLRFSAKGEAFLHKVDPNSWNRTQLLRYFDNKDGEKIVAHAWNNVVKWGENYKSTSC